MISFKTFFKSLLNNIKHPVKPFLKIRLSAKNRFHKICHSLHILKEDKTKSSKSINPEKLLSQRTVCSNSKPAKRITKILTPTTRRKRKRSVQPKNSQISKTRSSSYGKTKDSKDTVKKLQRDLILEQNVKLQKIVLELQHSVNKLVSVVFEYSPGKGAANIIPRETQIRRKKVTIPLNRVSKVKTNKSIKRSKKLPHHRNLSKCCIRPNGSEGNHDKNEGISKLLPVTCNECKTYNSTGVYNFLCENFNCAERSFDKQKAGDSEKFISDICRSYWVYYFQSQQPKCPPPSLMSIAEPAVVQNQDSNGNDQETLKGQIRTKIKGLNTTPKALPEVKAPELLIKTCQKIGNHVTLKKNCDNSSQQMMKNDKLPIKHGKITKKILTSHKNLKKKVQRMCGGANVPKDPKDPSYEDKIKESFSQKFDDCVEEEENVNEEEAIPPCCKKDLCDRNCCWPKYRGGKFQMAPCKEREIEKKAALGCYDSDSCKSSSEEVCKSKCFYDPEHPYGFDDNDDKPEEDQCGRPYPIDGTVYNSTYYRKCSPQTKKKRKVPEQMFEIRTSYYPHDRYPPSYHPYKSYSMTRFRCKVGKRQTPGETPKSPIGATKKCKRPKVEKMQNTEFCPCRETDFLYKSCTCPKPLPPPKCRCLIPQPTCVCGQVKLEQQLKKDYQLYFNDRQILRRCIIPDGELSDLQDPNEDPCDPIKKRFNYQRNRYDRIDTKCNNPYCGTCHEDPNLQWCFKVKKVYAKKRCVNKTPECEEEYFGEEEGEGEGEGEGEEKEYEKPCTIYDLDCCSGKKQFDTYDEREKKAKKYPYNKFDEEAAGRIREMLKQAFAIRNYKPEEGEEEQEESIECEPKRTIESSDSIVEEMALPMRKPSAKKKIVKKRRPCRKVKQVQQDEKFKGVCPTDICSRYPCFCYINPDLRRKPLCNYVKQWYCLPPKGTIDTLLFTSQLIPQRLHPDPKTPRKEPKRCDPFNP